jgi:hypothetical protein
MPAPHDPPWQPQESSSPPVAQTVEAGFDWDSAAIGGAVVLLVLLGGVGFRRHRDQVGMAR